MIFELIQTEEEYISDLNTLLNACNQLVASSHLNIISPVIRPVTLDDFSDRIFGSIKPILDWETTRLLIPLREKQAQQGPWITNIGDIVLTWTQGCSTIYCHWAGEYLPASSLLSEEAASNIRFERWLDVHIFFLHGADGSNCGPILHFDGFHFKLFCNVQLAGFNASYW